MYGSLIRKRREEFRCLVGDKVEEVKWKGVGVNGCEWVNVSSGTGLSGLSRIKGR